jgi:hypothetical protein
MPKSQLDNEEDILQQFSNTLKELIEKLSKQNIVNVKLLLRSVKEKNIPKSLKKFMDGLKKDSNHTR